MTGTKMKLGAVRLCAAFTVLFFLHTPYATAHARWDLNGIVKPRNTSTGLKTAPCGGIARTASSVAFTPGQVVEVTWEETINHPGHYRIAFSPADDAAFDSNVLLDNIPDTMGSETPLPHLFKATVMLPAQPCDTCTLQLIQVMTNTNPPSNYYSCSDIKIAADNAGSGSGSTGGGSTTTTPTDPTQIAQNLLDDFTAADTDQDSKLTFAETQNILPGLTVQQFNALDANTDGFIASMELSAIVNPPASTADMGSANTGNTGNTGNTATPSGSNNNATDEKTSAPAAAAIDWNTLGAAIGVLAMLRYRRRRSA